MTTLTVDASDIRQFVDRSGQAVTVLEAEFTTAMERSVAAVQRDAMANTPQWTGTLRRAYKPEITPFLGTLTNTAEPYAIVIEEGRRPGAAMPPAGSLLDWMNSKGIAQGESDSVKSSVEFLIRRKIGRDGIVGRRMMANALQTNTPAIIREFQQALARFVGKMQ
jgi:hypothetical protein